MQMKCSRIPRDYLKLAAAALYLDTALAVTVWQSEGWEKDGDYINRSVSTWDDGRMDGRTGGEAAFRWTCIIRTVFRVFIVFLLLPLLLLLSPFLLPSFLPFLILC